jgi:hypothetical protein
MRLPARDFPYPRDTARVPYGRDYTSHRRTVGPGRCAATSEFRRKLKTSDTRYQGCQAPCKERDLYETLSLARPYTGKQEKLR